MGTAVRNVIGRLELVVVAGKKGYARRFHVASVLNGKRNSMAQPAISGVKSALMVPWI